MQKWRLSAHIHACTQVLSFDSRTLKRGCFVGRMFRKYRKLNAHAVCVCSTKSLHWYLDKPMKIYSLHYALQQTCCSHSKTSYSRLMPKFKLRQVPPTHREDNQKQCTCHCHHIANAIIWKRILKQQNDYKQCTGQARPTSTFPRRSNYYPEPVLTAACMRAPDARRTLLSSHAISTRRVAMASTNPRPSAPSR